VDISLPSVDKDIHPSPQDIHILFHTSVHIRENKLKQAYFQFFSIHIPLIDLSSFLGYTGFR